MTTATMEHRRKPKGLDIRGFEPNHKLPTSQHVAYFLDWAAKERGEEWWPWNLILKAITGRQTMPRLETQEVRLLRTCAARARHILQTKYGRDLVSRAGLVRATMGSLDTIKTAGVRVSGQIQSVQRRAMATMSIVNIKEIPATPENRPWIQLGQGLSSAVRTLSAPDLLRGLLPPQEVGEKK